MLFSYNVWYNLYVVGIFYRVLFIYPEYILVVWLSLESNMPVLLAITMTTGGGTPAFDMIVYRPHQSPQGIKYFSYLFERVSLNFESWKNFCSLKVQLSSFWLNISPTNCFCINKSVKLTETSWDERPISKSVTARWRRKELQKMKWCGIMLSGGMDFCHVVGKLTFCDLYLVYMQVRLAWRPPLILYF